MTDTHDSKPPRPSQVDPSESASAEAPATQPAETVNPYDQSDEAQEAIVRNTPLWAYGAMLAVLAVLVGLAVWQYGVNFSEPDLVAAHLAQAQSENPRLRAEAIRALGALADYPEAVQAVGQAVNDPSPAVQLAAIEALSNSPRRDENTLNLLVPALAESDPAVQQAAQDALVDLLQNQPELIQRVEVFVESSQNEPVRRRLEQAMLDARSASPSQPRTRPME